MDENVSRNEFEAVRDNIYPRICVRLMTLFLCLIYVIGRWLWNIRMETLDRYAGNNDFSIFKKFAR